MAHSDPLCPFSIALLLSVARIQRYEEQVRLCFIIILLNLVSCLSVQHFYVLCVHLNIWCFKFFKMCL